MSDAPEDSRDPRPVSAGQRGRGAGGRGRATARDPAVRYLASSALVKLALTGPESAELARWLAEHDGQPLVSSALYRAEVPRAVWQAEPGALPRSYKVIKRIARVALSPDVL